MIFSLFLCFVEGQRLLWTIILWDIYANTCKIFENRNKSYLFGCTIGQRSFCLWAILDMVVQKVSFFERLKISTFCKTSKKTYSLARASVTSSLFPDATDWTCSLSFSIPAVSSSTWKLNQFSPTLGTIDWVFLRITWKLRSDFWKVLRKNDRFRNNELYRKLIEELIWLHTISVFMSHKCTLMTS